MALKVKLKHKNVLTLDGEEVVKNVKPLISKYQVIVVTEGNKIIGYLTSDEIGKANDEERLKDIIKKGRSVLTITGKEDPLEILNLMVRSHIDYLIIVDEKGRVKGALSIDDALENVKRMIKNQD
ncbi:CBS domain-containing protein [Acidianus ambivalens]|uniref:CBS domain-containing protein n=1 Tax=Acidianus ambivalens TaxID=2283 RepID=A0A650CVR5_ACIAM|nr:CBS domain-containing protein [Acidianus ambivalens]MQL56539.1 CBS domain-containing protein [Acidianus ambivalens]QGR21936.1 CBS domain-containing protein [Acidianus ambivalens]